jgi:hypothetical protein
MTSILATLQFGDFAIIAWLALVFGGGGAAAAYASRLRRIERKLDALLKQQGVLLAPGVELSERVQQLARDPVHIKEAIMLHQAETGLGLAEAKSEVANFVRTILKAH